MRQAKHCGLQDNRNSDTSAKRRELTLQVATKHDFLADSCREGNRDGEDSFEPSGRIRNRTSGGVTAQNELLQSGDADP
jgi:hypothetical protein